MEGRVCTVCKIQKHLVDFYAHPSSPGGKMTKCKECHKAYVRAWYKETRPERAAYERKRFQEPGRKANVAVRVKEYNLRNPTKYQARYAVSNAVRDGRLKRMPCEVCGSLRVQAHHHDYSKPLDVKWLCFRCHREEEHGQVVTDTGGAPGGLAAAAE